MKSRAKRRPAETGSAGAAFALLLGRVAGIEDPDVLVALGVVIGLVPAGVTWLVNLIGRG